MELAIRVAATIIAAFVSIMVIYVGLFLVWTLGECLYNLFKRK